MGPYLIDTNILTYYITGELKSNEIDSIENLITVTPNISIISQIELLCWHAKHEDESAIESLIADCNVINITDDIVSSCVLIRKEVKIKLPDAIIAATAIANSYVLITNNTKDFKRIKGLKIFNPMM